jgi:YspA, cpYpsA-related SLOG family
LTAPRAPRDDRLAPPNRADTLAPMRVIVCGGHDLETPAWVWRELDRLHAELGFTALMQGGRAGVDRFASEWAATHPEVECCVCRAQWQRYGAAAAPKRNARMLEWKPNLVIAFASGSGTSDLVKQATAAGVEVRRVPGPVSATRRR